MSLYRTQAGVVSHADAVPHVRAVPNKREAEAAYISIIAKLNFKQVGELDREISTLRDFIWSR